MKLEGGGQSVLLTAAQITSAARVYAAMHYSPPADLEACLQQCCSPDLVYNVPQLSPGVYVSVPDGFRADGIQQVMALFAELNSIYKSRESSVKQVSGCHRTVLIIHEIVPVTICMQRR